MSPVAYSQYYQMEEGILGDWHPPIMAAHWQLCQWICSYVTGEKTTGEGLLWTSWMLIMWGGLCLIIQSNKSFWQNKGKSQKSWGIVVIAIFCVAWFLLDCFNEPRIIVKDTGMLAA
jgi:hypothetical protein